MLSVKAREAADTIFKVFGMTQLRIKPNLPCFAGERSNHRPRSFHTKKIYQITLALHKNAQPFLL